MQEMGLARAWESGYDQQGATARNAALDGKLATRRACPPIPWTDSESAERKLSLGAEKHGVSG
jgi:hypothetical protein